jgi:hypothetical protein
VSKQGVVAEVLELVEAAGYSFFFENFTMPTWQTTFFACDCTFWALF